MSSTNSSASSSANNNSRSEGSQPVSTLDLQWDDLANTACSIRRQLDKVRKDYAASQRLLRYQKRRCIKAILKENTDVTNVLTNTIIVKSVIESPSQISMSTLAGLLRYLQTMLLSSYMESQVVAVNFLKMIKDQYWEDILRTSRLEVDNFTGTDEKRRIESASKAKDLLVNVALNGGSVKLHSTVDASILNSCIDTFIIV